MPDHIEEAEKMVYDGPQAAIAHALIAIADELRDIRFWVSELAAPGHCTDAGECTDAQES